MQFFNAFKMCFSIFVNLFLFEKKGFQISMYRGFSEKNQEKIMQNRTLPKNWEFRVYAKQALSKKLGISPKFVTHTIPNFR